MEKNSALRILDRIFADTAVLFHPRTLLYIGMVYLVASSALAAGGATAWFISPMRRTSWRPSPPWPGLCGEGKLTDPAVGSTTIRRLRAG